MSFLCSTSQYVTYWNLSVLHITAGSEAVLQQSGSSATFPQWYIVIYKPGKTERKLSQISKPHAFGSRWFTSFPLPNCSLVPLLHLAVVFESKWKHFSSPEADQWRGGKVFAVARPFRTGLSTLPISPLPSFKPVVVRPLICCNLPLKPRCQNRSYFRSHGRVSSAAKQNLKDTQENKRCEKMFGKKGGG